MSKFERDALDRHITGNWGEDSVSDDDIVELDLHGFAATGSANWSSSSDLTHAPTYVFTVTCYGDEVFTTNDVVAAFTHAKDHIEKCRTLRDRLWSKPVVRWAWEDAVSAADERPTQPDGWIALSTLHNNLDHNIFVELPS